MAIDLTQNDINETPDPNATPTITLSQGGSISSATSGQTQNPNLSFDNTTPNSQSVTADNTVPWPAYAPSTATSGSVTLQVATRTDNMILTNCLNGYIDVIYNVSLAIVSQSAKNTIMQGTIDQANSITSDDYIVFASTADTATDVTQSSDGNNLDYYNIQRFSFTSFLGHLPQNPMIAVTWDGTMSIYEPYGFQLREDLDAMASGIGYGTPLSPLSYLFRLEIWFSGYDPISGSWTSQIPIPCPQPNNSANTLQSIIYFLSMTAVEAKVNPSGTYYDLSFQTSGHYATRPENIIMHKDSIGKGGVQIDGSKGQTFGQFLQQLANKLNQQVLVDTQNKLNITYKFTGLKPLFDAQFLTDVNTDFSTGVSGDTGSGGYTVSGHAIDIYTFIHNVMINLDLVRQLMLREDDPGFIQPGTWWNIRSRVTQDEGPDSQMNSNTQYTFEYVFEPVLSYRSRMSELSEWNQQVDSSNQQQRVAQMLQYGMLIRWYDYYFTSDNSEVIDFQFKFKNFYFQQLPYPGPEVSLRGVGHNTQDVNKTDGISGTQNQTNASASQQSQNVVTPNLTFNASSSNTSSTLNSLLSIDSSPVSASTPPSADNPGFIHQHRHRGPVILNTNDSSYDAYATKAMAARDQYLRFDMVTADMSVRFDPQWLINPYMAGSDFTPTVPTSQTQNGDFVYAHIDRVVYLNAYAPNQKSFMNPDPSVFNIRETPILGGLYQVLFVVNEFEGGRFTQKLNLMKYDHLNYYSAANSNTGIQQGTSTSSTGAGGFTDLTPDPSATSTIQVAGL